MRVTYSKYRENERPKERVKLYKNRMAIEAMKEKILSYYRKSNPKDHEK
ncbi:hypothetical protein [Pleomorphovibrio marinus]|nr:hypothetical protein [Pleomorphovibrio marinus]